MTVSPAEALQILTEARLQAHRWRDSLPRELLDDLAQEATIRAVLAPDIENRTAYVRVVLRHLAISFWRTEKRHRQRRNDPRPLELVDPTAPIRTVEARHDFQALQERFELKPHFAEILALMLDEDRWNEVRNVDPGARDRMWKKRDRAFEWARHELGRIPRNNPRDWQWG